MSLTGIYIECLPGRAVAFANAESHAQTLGTLAQTRSLYQTRQVVAASAVLSCSAYAPTGIELLIGLRHAL
jgi:hypothetical protein